ncbi:TetR/AcrR family transcriptional regulator [Bermanella marisrubri]|nr:TetR/AcrR family transcriptional regulator [Bermanella marisrubri]QIZ83750.1 TetR/AcrR family transcriptional regulator [Bermanella marisrubri]
MNDVKKISSSCRIFGKKQNYHHGDLAFSLMQAALQRIAKEGVDKLSLRAVARDLGVSQTAPYRHFKDKQALLVALAKQGFEELTQTTLQATQYGQKDSLKTLMAIGMAYVNFARRHPEQYKLMFGPSISNRAEQLEMMEAGNQSFNVILNATEKAVEEGVLIDDDYQLLARSCWSKVHGMAMLCIDGFYKKRSEKDLQNLFMKMQWINLRGISKHPLSINPPEEWVALTEQYLKLASA